MAAVPALGALSASPRRSSGRCGRSRGDAVRRDSAPADGTGAASVVAGVGCRPRALGGRASRRGAGCRRRRRGRGGSAGGSGGSSAGAPRRGRRRAALPVAGAAEAPPLPPRSAPRPRRRRRPGTTSSSARGRGHRLVGHERRPTAPAAPRRAPPRRRSRRGRRRSGGSSPAAGARRRRPRRPGRRARRDGVIAAHAPGRWRDLGGPSSAAAAAGRGAHGVRLAAERGGRLAAAARAPWVARRRAGLRPSGCRRLAPPRPASERPPALGLRRVCRAGACRLSAARGSRASGRGGVRPASAAVPRRRPAPSRRALVVAQSWPAVLGARGCARAAPCGVASAVVHCRSSPSCPRSRRLRRTLPCRPRQRAAAGKPFHVTRTRTRSSTHRLDPQAGGQRADDLVDAAPSRPARSAG